VLDLFGEVDEDSSRATIHGSRVTLSLRKVGGPGLEVGRCPATAALQCGHCVRHSHVYVPAASRPHHVSSICRHRGRPACGAA
jgi:hypothetical protein